jgi:CBS domain-containing membrane protein
MSALPEQDPGVLSAARVVKEESMAHALHMSNKVQLPTLATHHSRRLVFALFVAVSSAVSIATITAVAYLSDHPLVVPSLGPTAFLVFNRSQSPAARPRNIMVGHLIGAVAGYLALATFGLAHAPPVTHGGLTPPRIGAAALSIALTTGAMILFGAEHGPAGATTLIISLGFMTTVSSVALLMAGVVALAIQGVAIDRFFGLHIPYWSGQHHHRRQQPQPGHLEPLPGPPRPPVNGHRRPRPLHRTARPARLVTQHDRVQVIPPGQGRGVLVGNQRCAVKVEDARTDGTYCLLELLLDPGEQGTLLHAHYDFAETYIITQGQLDAQVGDRTLRAGPGSIIHIPPGVPHELRTRGRQSAACWCITTHARQSEPEYLP